MDAALRWARDRRLTTDGELSYHYDLHHINLARVLVARAPHIHRARWLDEALTLLGRLQAAAAQAGWIQEEIKVGILQARAMQAQGNSQSALMALCRVLPLAEPGGYIRLFIDEGAPMRLLLTDFGLRIDKQAGEGHKLIGYVDKLQAAFAPIVPAPQSEVSNPAPLRSGDYRQKSTLVEPLSQRKVGNPEADNPGTLES